MEDLMDSLKENPGRGPTGDVKSLDILRPFNLFFNCGNNLISSETFKLSINQKPFSWFGDM